MINSGDQLKKAFYEKQADIFEITKLYKINRDFIYYVLTIK